MLEWVMEWIRCNLRHYKVHGNRPSMRMSSRLINSPVNRRHKPRNIADDNAEKKKHNCIINGDVIITSNYGAFHPSRSNNCGVRLKQLILPLHVVCSVSTTYHRWHHAARIEWFCKRSRLLFLAFVVRIFLCKVKNNSLRLPRSRLNGLRSSTSEGFVIPLRFHKHLGVHLEGSNTNGVKVFTSRFLQPDLNKYNKRKRKWASVVEDSGFLPAQTTIGWSYNKVIQRRGTNKRGLLDDGFMMVRWL